MKSLIYNQILGAVEQATEVPRERILSREKLPEVVEARALLFHFLIKKKFRQAEISRLTKLSRQCVSAHIADFDTRKGKEGSIMSLCYQDIITILSAPRQ